MSSPITPLVDYDAMAKKHGAVSSEIDYDALAKQHGAVSSDDQPGPLSRFVSSVGAAINPIPAVKEFINRPNEIAKAQTALGTIKQLKSQGVAEDDTRMVEAVQGAMGAKLGPGPMPPVLPPGSEPAFKAADQARSGDLAGSAGTLMGGYGVPVALSQVPAISKTFKISAKPEDASALDFAERRGIPVGPAPATQNKFLGSMKSILERQPFTAGPMAEFQNASEASLAETGSQLAHEVAPTGARTKLTAGTNVVHALGERVDQLNQKANAAYTRLREIATHPDNVRSVQVGSEPSGLVDPAGNPITRPIFEDIASPTDYGPVKQALKPLLAKFERQIPEAQKQASPGLQILRQVMERPDTVDLDTAMADLSAIQNVSRVEIPAIRTASQRIAATVVKPLRNAIDGTAEGLGEEAYTSLNQGRSLTAQKASLGKTLQSQIKSEPVRVVNRLIANEDGGVRLLETVARETPDVIPDVARATLERILENATKSGGFKNVNSTANLWTRLGPRTKELLFGPERTADLNDFFRLGQMIGENPNPSGSATVGASVGLLKTAAHSPAAAMASLIGAKKFANFLMSPNGVAAAKKGLTIDVGTALGKSAMLNLLTKGADDAQQ